MTHVITAFVAQIPTLQKIDAKYPAATVIPLKQGFGLIPLTQDFRNAVQSPKGKRIWTEEELLHSLHGITDVLTKIGRAASHSSAIAYIETEYFGGEGVQGALVWSDGEIVLEPLISASIGPINSALRELGVQRGRARDEFDALGLGKHRQTDAWLKEIKT